MTRLATPISDHAHPKTPKNTQKCFDQLYVNLYQHAKNQANSLICSGDSVD